MIRTIVDGHRGRDNWHAFDHRIDAMGRGESRETAILDLARQLSLPDLTTVTRDTSNSILEHQATLKLLRQELRRRGVPEGVA